MIVIPLALTLATAVSGYLVYRGLRSGGSWTAKEGVVLNGTLERFLDDVAKRSGVTFMASSGTRSAASQASAIAGKVAVGNTPDDLRRLYNDTLINEVLAAPQEQWASVIAAQTARGVGLSSHLRGAGVDISMHRPNLPDLTSTEKAKVIAAGMSAGASSYQHEDVGTINEHIHFTVEGFSSALTTLRNLSPLRVFGVLFGGAAVLVGTTAAAVVIWKRARRKRRNPRRRR